MSPSRLRMRSVNPATWLRTAASDFRYSGATQGSSVLVMERSDRFLGAVRLGVSYAF